MAEEEDEEEWYDSWESEIPLITKKRITAGSMKELLQLVEEYLQDLDSMDQSKRPRIPLMNFHSANNPAFRGMKVLPTRDSSWQALLFFDDKIDLSRR
jgi:hypothetical protein